MLDGSELSLDVELDELDVLLFELVSELLDEVSDVVPSPSAGFCTIITPGFESLGNSLIALSCLPT